MIEFSSVKSLRLCLQRGIGVTMCPEISVREEIAAGRLVKLSGEADDTETSVIMIWHAERWCSPLLKRFMEISKAVFEQPR